MIVLGIKGSGHDTGAAIVGDDAGTLRIVAISEERLNRSKHSRQYPLMSIDYCLRAFGLKSLAEVDVVASDRHNGSLQFLAGKSTPYPGTDHRPSFSYAADKHLSVGTAKRFGIHHLLAHAASTYFLSPFEDAAILVVDAGMGIFSGRGNEVFTHELMGYGPTVEEGKVTQRQLTPGPGMLFNAVTEHLGYGPFGPGKTMALASYGHLCERRDLLPVPENRHTNPFIDYSMSLQHLLNTVPRFDVSRDHKGAEGVLDSTWVNLARQMQELLEEDMVFLSQNALARSTSRNLCLAGGVALSCVTNRRIYDSGVCNSLFIQPASSDEGVPLGCALAGYYINGGRTRKVMHNAYLGAPNDTRSAESALRRSGMNYRRSDDRAVAKLLAEGRIIGRVYGGAEYGPRALGNRSILADPRRPYMTEVLNRRVKHRELFRPFAPSCHADKVNRYFEMPVEGPFMIFAAPVRAEARHLIPAIVHVDGSCRPQTVRPDQNPEYYNLIEEFGRLTDIYCLINTSFNDNSEPIVETYEDALASFLKTGLDHLYIDGYLVDRPAVGKTLPASFIPQRTARDVEARYDALAQQHCDFDEFRRLRVELESRAEQPAVRRNLLDVA